MLSRFETAGKSAVRENWNTPILKYIHNTYGIKYRYLGLPGVDLIDINLWRDMLKEIIAFELPDEGSDERKSIVLLKKKLELMGIPYKAFYGSIEHVVLSRADIDDTKYSQDKLITLYNLDFCDEITSKIPTPTGKKCLRFELLRQLLTDQHECYRSNSKQDKFIILLTARNQTSSSFMRSYLFDDEELDASTNKFILDANKYRPIPSTDRSLIKNYSWTLKAFFFNTLRSYLTTPHLTSLFFPMVKYTGKPIDATIESPMMHWMFLCKFENPELPRPKVYPKNYLFKSSLTVSGRNISMSKGPGENLDSMVDPLRILKEYEGYFFND